MSLEVKRKKGESFDSLMRRFQRRYQQSGRGVQTKKNRFFAPQLNQTKKRALALRRNRKKEQQEYLLKSGKLKEEPRRRSFRR